MEKLKIVSFSNPTAEGVALTFNRPVRFSPVGMKTKERWLSWDRVAELLEEAEVRGNSNAG